MSSARHGPHGGGTPSRDVCAGLDLNGKPVAVFGLGDSVSYGEYFCDAMEEVYRFALTPVFCCSADLRGTSLQVTNIC